MKKTVALALAAAALLLTVVAGGALAGDRFHVCGPFAYKWIHWHVNPVWPHLSHPHVHLVWSYQNC